MRCAFIVCTMLVGFSCAYESQNQRAGISFPFGRPIHSPEWHGRSSFKTQARYISLSNIRLHMLCVAMWHCGALIHFLLA